VSARFLLIWLALQYAISMPSANGMDPFYSDAQWQALRESYLHAVTPKHTKRSPTEIPIGLLLETTRLPKFETKGATLAEALVKLKDQFFSQTQIAFPECLITPERASGDRTITLALTDLSVIECLRYIGEMGGSFYSVQGNTLTFGSYPPTLNPWSRLEYKNLPISEALASHWFPEAKKRSSEGDISIWPAEKDLEKHGIPFPENTKADFVSNMNILACIQGDIATTCLKTLIAETEAQFRIESVLNKSQSLPDGMELRSLKPGVSLEKYLARVLERSGRYLVPNCATTKDVLEYNGISFPLGAFAWWDRHTKTLHTVNTPAQISIVKVLCSAE
jgi:hypothetical protein